MTDPALERPRLRAADVQPYLIVLGMAAAMWVLEIIDLLPGVGLDRYGVRPRQTAGIPGIVAAPFLHEGFGHLIGNTVPFLVLGMLVAASGTRVLLEVTGIVALSAGLGVWLVAPDHTVHIGASGLVFGYLSFLIVRGFFARKLGQIVLGVVVLFFYGGIFWGLLPHPGISWQGHAFGAIGGVVAAWMLRDHQTEADEPVVDPYATPGQ